LSAAGEYLALNRPDGTTATESLSEKSELPDTASSYGSFGSLS